MLRKRPFRRHRFPSLIILSAVRMYLRYPLSYQDVADLLGERAVDVDRSTIFRWVQKFRSELARRTEGHLRRASLNWHVDETYIRVGGKWRYLWRAIDANGQLVDFRLTTRRDAKAAKAFLNKVIERVCLHRPVSICTDKAPTCPRLPFGDYPRQFRLEHWYVAESGPRCWDIFSARSATGDHAQHIIRFYQILVDPFGNVLCFERANGRCQDQIGTPKAGATQP